MGCRRYLWYPALSPPDRRFWPPIVPLLPCTPLGSQLQQPLPPSFLSQRYPSARNTLPSLFLPSQADIAYDSVSSSRKTLVRGISLSSCGFGTLHHPGRAGHHKTPPILQHPHSLPDNLTDSSTNRLHIDIRVAVRSQQFFPAHQTIFPPRPSPPTSQPSNWAVQDCDNLIPGSLAHQPISSILSPNLRRTSPRVSISTNQPGRQQAPQSLHPGRSAE